MRLIWTGHIARVRDVKNVYRILMEIPLFKRPLIRLRKWCDDNIKMDLREVVRKVGKIKVKFSLCFN
jgi:hypothetical protein